MVAETVSHRSLGGAQKSAEVLDQISFFTVRYLLLPFTNARNQTHIHTQRRMHAHDFVRQGLALGPGWLRTSYVDKAVLRIVAILSLPPKYCDYRHVPPSPAESLHVCVNILRLFV